MSQESLIILCLKIGLITGFCSLIAWVAVYSRLAKWRANPIGRTLVIETLLIAALFAPTTLNLFLHLGRGDSRLVGWIDVVLIGAVTPVMCWRCVVWLRLSRAGRPPRNGHDGLGGSMRLSRADVLTGAAGFGASLALGALVYIAVSVHDGFAQPPGAIPLPPAASSSSAPAVASSPPASLTPSPSPSAPPASLSPVLALRYSPGTVTATGEAGTGSAGTAGGSGGSPGSGGSGGSGGGPQPSYAPSPAPSPSTPHPSPSPPPPAPGCVIHIGALRVCASVKIGVPGA